MVLGNFVASGVGDDIYEYNMEIEFLYIKKERFISLVQVTQLPNRCINGCK